MGEGGGEEIIHLLLPQAHTTVAAYVQRSLTQWPNLVSLIGVVNVSANCFKLLLPNLQQARFQATHCPMNRAAAIG